MAKAIWQLSSIKRKVRAIFFMFYPRYRKDDNQAIFDDDTQLALFCPSFFMAEKFYHFIMVI
ncbi:MAG: hypothetical protein R3Y11_03110 [Pseudomonadota bacterium]